MTKKKGRNPNVQAIIQALNAAETNIKLAKSLLSSVPLSGAAAEKKSPRDIPGVMGVFDGESMVTESGKKYPVNPNYASKSQLVVGDTLKMIEEEGKNFFKQVQKVERQQLEGILVKKDGRFVAVTAEGSYNLLPEAVDFCGAGEGAKVVVLVPKENAKVPFAALAEVVKEEAAKKKDKEKEEVKSKTVKAKTAKKPAKKKDEEEKEEETVVAPEVVAVPEEDEDEELR